ncbi:alpha/beta fold hydrolase [Demequina muriae]|uniref:Alpha/beta hydrolase n=1 Tax=Demequina muriae TaxID=3051664 RepID=A0ABT8GI65_9MICO|nr:alpha/beta hydrolase [Demequina sp. EGI L300058]MDN4481128.1 alpha/beta hydrolase [Demequina sp. EGI L300058]
MSLIPDAAPIVLLNAFPLDRQQWEPLITVLGDRVRGDLITFDMPGIGEMPLTDEDPGLDLIADAAVLAMREATGADAAVWIGCSMGGYVALAVAQRWPDAVAGLGLICTKATADGDEARAKREQVALAAEGANGHPDPHAAAESMVGMEGAGRDELVEWVAANVALQRGDGIAWGQRAMAARPDRTEVLRAVDAPVVAVIGGADGIVDRADADAMAAAAGVEPVVLDGVGHLAALEAPAATADALEPLLRA